MQNFLLYFNLYLLRSMNNCYKPMLCVYQSYQIKIKLLAQNYITTCMRYNLQDIFFVCTNMNL